MGFLQNHSMVRRVSGFLRCHRAQGAFLAMIVCLLPMPSYALAQSSAPNRQEIETIIRDYILKNPDVVQDALVELDKRQKEAQLRVQKEAVRSEQAVLTSAEKNIVVGNPQGDVTLVEFFDYNCGYCKRALNDLQQLLKRDGKVRVILKDFPVLGADSVEVSRLAIAAKKQLSGEKYFNFHIKLMGLSGRITKERAMDVAKESGLDVVRLEKDAQSDNVRQTIEETVTLGDRLGLTGTPAYVIGDEIVFGAVGVDALSKAITNVRQCGKLTC